MKIQRKIDKYVVVAFEIKGDRIGISCGEGVCDSMDATELFREWEPATVENIAKSVWRPPKPTVEPAFTVEEVKHICDLTDDGFDVDDAMNKILKQPESVKHTSCDGCVHKGINFFMCGGCFCHTETMSNQERSNWTPKQPEPVAPVKEFNSDLTLAEARIEQLEKVVKEIIAECYSCQYTTYWKVLDIIKEVVGETGSPKEPKAEPGLVKDVQGIGKGTPSPI